MIAIAKIEKTKEKSAVKKTLNFFSFTHPKPLQKLIEYKLCLFSKLAILKDMLKKSSFCIVFSASNGNGTILCRV